MISRRREPKLPFLVRINIVVLLLCASVLIFFYSFNKKSESGVYNIVPTSEYRAVDVPQYSGEPENYVCYQSTKTLRIDGKLNESDWESAVWTKEFGDIEGEIKPAPRFKTQAKMLWDEEYFYIGFAMEEPHLWATYDKHDMVVYHENDIEVFMDPDGDTHNYYEIEVNALNTIWDLMLTQPYRDHGKAIDAWDAHGLKTAVNLNGTLNNGHDTDKGWTVEMAIPWSVLEECAYHEGAPEDNECWRINFSRVEYETEFINGKYEKKKDANGNKIPEANWTWSPQGLIAMHFPEMWGVVQFSEIKAGSENTTEYSCPVYAAEKKRLRSVYYAQRDYFPKNFKFCNSLEELEDYADGENIEFDKIKMKATQYGFEAVTVYKDNRTLVHIDETGRTWTTTIKAD